MQNLWSVNEQFGLQTLIWNGLSLIYCKLNILDIILLFLTKSTVNEQLKVPYKPYFLMHFI